MVVAVLALVGCVVGQPPASMSVPIELDPRDPNDQQEIIRKLHDCEFDVIFDVRSHHYYDNWRLAGGEHMPDASQFDPERLATQNISSVAFYCWNDPWESEPAAQWFAQQYGNQGVQVYDLKGLSYLDDVPGMCQYIDGDEEAIAQHSPHCAGEGGVGMRSGVNRCEYATTHETGKDQETIVLDPKVMVATILCAVGLMSMLIVGCYMCSRGGEADDQSAAGKLDDPWENQRSVARKDFEDCELCKAGLTGLVPAAPVTAVPDGTYPASLPGTPDSDVVDSIVGAHGLAVTPWESTDEEHPPRDAGTEDVTVLQATSQTATEAGAASVPSP